MVPLKDKSQLRQESCQPKSGDADIALALVSKCQSTKERQEFPPGLHCYPQLDGVWKQSMGNSSWCQAETKCGPKQNLSGLIASEETLHSSNLQELDHTESGVRTQLLGQGLARNYEGACASFAHICEGVHGNFDITQERKRYANRWR